MRLRGAYVSQYVEQVVSFPQTTFWPVLKVQLHMKPYKLSLVQAHTNDD